MSLHFSRNRAAGIVFDKLGVQVDAPREELAKLYKNISSVILGKKEPILLSMVSLLCEGHLLVEDVPGVGKTMLARSLARSVNAGFKRLQCTPDMLPSDVTGVSIYNPKTLEFEFRPGPVFTNLLLVDEINRATPRTQSSLLECMAESQVTVEGHTYPMQDVFMVIATQNPVEFAGTYPLPEAQLDRFFMRVNLGYPALADEVNIMNAQRERHPIEDLKPVLDTQALLVLQRQVPKVTVTEDVQAYIAEIVQATRKHPELELGASPRGSIALMKAAQAVALIGAKTYVDPQTVKQVAVPVLAHRLITRSRAQSLGKSAEVVVADILNQVKVPVATAAAG
jgi:MoxR-like ATPase